MESILLGGLALVGYNTLKPKEIINNENKKLDNSYMSNISDKMVNIEKKQANNLKNKPEFFKQFDELTFDNMSEPVSVIDSHISITGINHSLQRGLDLNNGYSNIDDLSDYGVINKENFIHNNMTPNTNKRDYTTNSDHSSRKLEAFTGVSDYWVPKKEKTNLFEPMKDLTYVNGMPVMTDYLDSRYLASNKNNMGNLPFENNLKIKPGLDSDIRQGLGTVYRIEPRTVDELRGEHNQKISYENKPLETVKKGEYRAPDFNLTKYKLPDFRENHFEDLVAGRSQTEGSRKTGKYTDVNTQRGDCNQSTYNGHAYAPTMGEAPSKNKTKFEPSKKQEMYNDPTHAVVGVNVKPVMQNKKSYVNTETQRASMQATQIGATFDNNGGSYTVDPNYVPLTTLRQLMIDGNTNIGVTGSQQKANYVFSNDMVLPTTIKETTMAYKNGFVNPTEKTGASQFTDIAKKTTKESTLTYKGGFANPMDKMGSSQFTDTAKKTTKETTLGYKGGFANPMDKTGSLQFTDTAKNTTKETTLAYKGGFANPMDKVGASQFTDTAKKTIKETTVTYKGGFANPMDKVGASQFTDTAKKTTKETTLAYKGGFANPMDKIGASQFTDTAKITIKQTTLHTTPGVNIGSQVSNGYTKNYDDIAKTTIKQTTENNNYKSNVTSIEAQLGYTRDEKDLAKVTIKQTTLYRTPGMNVSGIEAQMGYTRDEKDIAKNTIKQTTENNNSQGHIHGTDNYSSYIRDENDIAKTTIKQTTENNNYQGPVYGSDNYSGYIRDENNIAKTTIKETTHLQDYTGIAHGNERQTSHMSADNICIDERREISMYNRTSGGGTNLAGPQINKDKVKMNSKKTSIFYVTAPGKSLDQSVMPSHGQSYNNNTVENKKPQLSYDDYRTNNIFINTLKDNPLVNDIHHQKNV